MCGDNSFLDVLCNISYKRVWTVWNQNLKLILYIYDFYILQLYSTYTINILWMWTYNNKNNNTHK